MIAFLLTVTLLSMPGLGQTPQATGCATLRDSHGKIQRSRAALVEFAQREACPSTGRNEYPCPGYVVDHIWPLCAHGCDVPENMQWQESKASKAKDKWEVRLCKLIYEAEGRPWYRKGK